jgi:hypothetical protein
MPPNASMETLIHHLIKYGHISKDYAQIFLDAYQEILYSFEPISERQYLEYMKLLTRLVKR